MVAKVYVATTLCLSMARKPTKQELAKQEKEEEEKARCARLRMRQMALLEELSPADLEARKAEESHWLSWQAMGRCLRPFGNPKCGCPRCVMS